MVKRWRSLFVIPFLIVTAVIAKSALDRGSVQKLPVILDTDIGVDMDDTWALVQVLSQPKFDLKLVLTAAGNTPRKADLVAKILSRLNRTDIPIGIGVQTDSGLLAQEAWIGDYTRENYQGRVIADGVGAFVKMIRRSKHPITVITIGPQTNLSAALKRSPSIARNSRIVAMAGSFYRGYDGATDPVPESNVVSDIKSAQSVLRSGWPITLVPLDICGMTTLKGAQFEMVRTSRHKGAQVIIENFEKWVHRPIIPDNQSSILFDTVAVQLAIDKGLARYNESRVTIDDNGYTRFDPAGMPARVALDWRHEKRFLEKLAETIAKADAKPKRR